MSLLDTFTLLFTVDSEDAVKETEKLSESLEETSTAAEGSSVALEETTKSNALFSASLEKSVKDLLKVSAALSAFKSMLNLAGQTDQLGKFSKMLGESVEDIGAIGEATKREGGSVEAFKGSISGLQKSLTNLTLTGGGEIASVLARLGISALDATGKAKDAVDLLPEIARSFQGMDKAKSLGLGQMLGLDPATIMLLQKGEAGFKGAVASAKELGVTTAEDAEAAAEFKNAWNDLTQIMLKSRTTINTLILPVLTSIIDGYTEITRFISDHKSAVIGFFVAIGVYLTRVYYPAMIKVVAATMRAAAATYALVAPYLLTAAVIIFVAGLVGMLIEDFIAFGNGQDSLIGRLSEKWPTFGKIMKAVFDGIKTIIDSLAKSFQWLGEQWDKLDFSSFEKMKSSFSDVFGFGDDDEATINSNKNIDLISKNDQAAHAITAQTAVNNVNSQTSKNNTTNIDKIEIKVASPNADPTAVASAVGDQLQKHLAMANASNSSGVM